eukprot:TRINITY_DN8783_c0_g1_i4.p1 TRINITY_DN8783_c0_g1~~TRINITY_DN8783_c0_g1_i4.p1  ORF type:complete len:323 (-),score=27.63 TRINITY_DN8783_c0_g1_i4:153-1121(-)
MCRRAQAILAVLGIFFWAASSSKIRSKDALTQATAKNYTQVPGEGWCTDNIGVNEATARRFEEVDCTRARNMCDSDAACVAYACMNGTFHGPVWSVLYTTTGCEVHCGETGWQTNPRLITKAQYTQNQPAWQTARCHVAYQPLNNDLCDSAGFMNSSTAVHSNAWTLQAATSEADCASKCIASAGCMAWTGNTSDWNFCYTTATYTRTQSAWPQQYTGQLKCANAASCGAFVKSNTSLGDPPGHSGSPWVLLPSTSREDCAAQCTYDSTCKAYKGGDDTGCLLTPNQPCKDFTCYLTPSYSISSVGWETDGPDWEGAYRSGC